ncbi:MAG: DNA polymerase III subunit delta [Deltaproteobacteria bacterium]|nr:DNA polymerase III subunit delta [Deltaproteobacteria bacterium]MBW2414225.1 DNA polymerase III subunit delta [Deltaproteobacteria bacterium]
MVLLVGPEATLRDEALADLRERALAGGPRDFNEDVFDLAAGGLDAVALAATLRTLPVLAPKRLVRLRGLSSKRAATFLERALPAYLEDPSATTCLVLEAESLDGRLRWVKRARKIGEHVECKAPKDARGQRAWIEARVHGSGKQPGRGMAAALLDRSGADLDRLASEIEKLSLYAGDRETLTPDDVALLSGDLRDHAIYELTDAIGARRLPEALRVLSQMLEHGAAPLAVLGGLGNHYRRLIRASECSPLDADEVSRRLSIKPFPAGKLVDQVRRFGGQRLRRGLDAVRRTDEALKGGTALAADLAIEQLVIAVSA